jgi:endonuclease-3
MAAVSSRRFAHESRSARAQRAQRIDRALADTFPDARCDLDFRTPFQLLVATILSAQTTDRQVNRVTPALFARYPDARALAESDLLEVEAVIRPVGFFRQKSRSLQGIGRELLECFGGEVPATMSDLATLPGVGRKTANVVLGNAFGIPGFPVDTHVTRVAGRLGLVKTTDPARIETELTQLLPEHEWTMASHRLIYQGRHICRAKRPACADCPIAALCPSAERKE